MYLNYENSPIEVENDKLKPLTTIEELHTHLQHAVELEFSTLPLYLSALYTIKEDTNTYAANVIRSVVMEEMYHMTSAANVLIATGGKPQINNPEFLPTFPTYLPDGETAAEASLLKFSQAALATFKFIEEPAEIANGVITIGEFYENIIGALELFSVEPCMNLFPEGTAPQIEANYYYGGGGRLEKVTDLKSAKRVLNAIVVQGEGLPMPDTETGILSGDHALFDQPRELAHFYRFDELYQQRRYKAKDTHGKPTGDKIFINFDDVYNMKPNPRSSDYDDLPELKQMNDEFNRHYSTLLDNLHDAFNGEPEKMGPATGAMFKLKYAAQELFRNPIPGTDFYAGPTWEYHS